MLHYLNYYFKDKKDVMRSSKILFLSGTCRSMRTKSELLGSFIRQALLVVIVGHNSYYQEFCCDCPAIRNHSLDPSDRLLRKIGHSFLLEFKSHGVPNGTVVPIAPSSSILSLRDLRCGISIAMPRSFSGLG